MRQGCVKVYRDIGVPYIQDKVLHIGRDRLDLNSIEYVSARPSRLFSWRLRLAIFRE
jgi:hypothetical protein